MSCRQPQPRDRHAAFGIGQKLYVWAGDSGRPNIPTTVIESFDVFSETWQRPQWLRGDLPTSLWDMAIATDGENAYSFGGWTYKPVGYDQYRKLYKINLSTLQCTELVPGYPSYTPNRTVGAAMVYFDQKLVLYGKWKDQDPTKIHVFDLKTGECVDF